MFDPHVNEIDLGPFLWEACPRVRVEIALSERGRPSPAMKSHSNSPQRQPGLLVCTLL